MNIQEAKAMLSPEAMEKLHEVVDIRPVIDISKKVNNDILMTAFCKAVIEEVIKPSSLNDRLVKLLNSETNTISQSKLKEILDIVHEKQPNICCAIMMDDYDGMDVIPRYDWVYKNNDVNFVIPFRTVLNFYNITPSDVRRKMTTTLKSTIVNNVSQLVSKFYKSTEEEQNKMIISISTIQRLVNMSGGCLTAEFYEDEKE